MPNGTNGAIGIRANTRRIANNIAGVANALIYFAVSPDKRIKRNSIQKRNKNRKKHTKKKKFGFELQAPKVESNVVIGNVISNTERVIKSI